MLELRMRKNVAGEFRSTITDVVAADWRKDPLAKLLHENLIYRNTDTMMMVKIVSDLPTLRELAETLESYGDGVGLDPEAMFRCRPFMRMAQQCRDRIRQLELAMKDAEDETIETLEAGAKILDDLYLTNRVSNGSIKYGE